MIEEISKDEKAGQLVQIASETKEQALSMLVRTPREYEQVSVFLSNIKAKANEIEAHRKYLKEPYLEGGRRVDEFFKPPLQALKDAETTAKQKLLGYQEEQRRIAAEEQRKLEEKARKEREALEAKAKAEREKADAEAQEIQSKSDEARAAGNLSEAVKLRHQATVLVEKSEAKVEAIQSKADQIIAPKVEAYIPPVAGQSSRAVWKARVLDAKAVPDEYKIVDVPMLDKLAQATKGKVPVPGVEFYSEQVMSARAGRT